MKNKNVSGEWSNGRTIFDLLLGVFIIFFYWKTRYILNKTCSFCVKGHALNQISLHFSTVRKTSKQETVFAELDGFVSFAGIYV